MKCGLKMDATFWRKQWGVLGRLLLSSGLCVVAIGCGRGPVPEVSPSPIPTQLPSSATVISPTVTPTKSAPVPQPNAASASLQVVPADARVGDALDVILRLSGVEALYGVEVHLTFDPSSVVAVDADPEVVGAQSEHGGFLSPDFVVRNVISQTEGVIYYAISQMPPRDPASGDGIVMTAHLEAAASGKLSVAVESLILASASEQSIPVTFETREAYLPIE